MTLFLLLHYMHPSPTWEECTNSGGRNQFYREADLSYEHESLEGEKRLNNGKYKSPSNIERTNNGLKNGFQNSSLCTSTQDL